MNSLVGYGMSSSDSENEGEDENCGCRSSCLTEEKTSGLLKTRNLLLESVSTSSESDNESEQEPEQVSSHAPAPAVPTSVLSSIHLPSPPSSLTLKKLPPPPLCIATSSSVFANPFKLQADNKLSALQKHVPLTLQAKPSQIDGKRMCVAYRKDGRCRFGIKCKFAHDSDLQSAIISSNYEAPTGDSPDAERVEAYAGGQHKLCHGKEKDPEGQQSRKRKVGLRNTLIPPKQTMKQYSLQTNRERVNMS